MTPEERAAFLFSQAVALQVELAGMQAENQMRASKGESPAYSEEDFRELLHNSPCAYNSAMMLLQGR